MPLRRHHHLRQLPFSTNSSLVMHKSCMYYVSRESSHSAPVTQLSADRRPLKRPHSKSFQPKFSFPYFFSICLAVRFARSSNAFSDSGNGCLALSIRCNSTWCRFHQTLSQNSLQAFPMSDRKSVV